MTPFSEGGYGVGVFDLMLLIQLQSCERRRLAWLLSKMFQEKLSAESLFKGFEIFFRTFTPSAFRLFLITEINCWVLW